MNGDLIISFIFGMGAGAVITFFTIILFANSMEKNQKKLAIEMGKAKVSTK